MPITIKSLLCTLSLMTITSMSFAQSEVCQVDGIMQIPTATPFSRLGRLVAVEDDILIIADSLNWEEDLRIYRQLDDQWELEQIIPHPLNATLFGNAICIADGRIFVAAKSAQNEPGIAEGAVFVYEYTGAQWELAQRVNLTNPSIPLLGEFGESIAATDQHLIVGSEAHVYFFKRTENQWQYVQSTGGTFGPRIGASVAVHGNTAILGRHLSASDQSTIDVWVNDGTSWIPNDQIQVTGLKYVVYDGTRVVTHSANSTRPIIYQRSDSPTGWTISFLESLGWDRMGSDSQVSIDYPYLLVGSSDNNKAAVFEHDGNQSLWTLLHELNGEDFDLENLGNSVGLSNSTIVLSNNNRKSPVMATIACTLCRADLNQNQMSDLEDVFLFILALSERNQSADFNEDGSINYLDISEFLHIHAIGCP